jgi:hypothetical protein
MAIRMMTSKETWLADPESVTVVTDYHGAEVGRVDHGDHCPNKAWDLSGALKADCVTEGSYGERCRVNTEPLYMQTTHKGLVLSLGERNGYDDSDFYAVIWNPEKGCTERVQYATTRGWTYPNSATVDATPEVLASYEAWCTKVREDSRKAKEATEAAEPKKGRMVKVVKGRKVPKGTVGTVIWYGACKSFGPVPRYRGNWVPAATPMRVGIKDATGAVHWTAASNVEVV